MADLTISIGDADMPLLIDALCNRYSYEPAEGDTDDTRAAFARDALASDLLDEVRGNEGRIASEKAAAEAAEAVAHLDITVT